MGEKNVGVGVETEDIHHSSMDETWRDQMCRLKLSDVSIETVSEVSIETVSNVSIETLSEVSMETVSEVSIETVSDVSI